MSLSSERSGSSAAVATPAAGDTVPSATASSASAFAAAPPPPPLAQATAAISAEAVPLAVAAATPIATPGHAAATLSPVGGVVGGMAERAPAFAAASSLAPDSATAPAAAVSPPGVEPCPAEADWPVLLALLGKPARVAPKRSDEVPTDPPCTGSGDGGGDGGGSESSAAACSMASLPLGQNWHARHLHLRLQEGGEREAELAAPRSPQARITGATLFKEGPASQRRGELWMRQPAAAGGCRSGAAHQRQWNLLNLSLQKVWH
jgi:hypothetical protein